VRDSLNNGVSLQQAQETYFAKFNHYSYMAHFVAKILGQRPSHVLSGWGVSELIVAYGHYANEQSYQNFMDWKSSQENAPKPNHLLFNLYRKMSWRRWNNWPLKISPFVLRTILKI